MRWYRASTLRYVYCLCLIFSLARSGSGQQRKADNVTFLSARLYAPSPQGYPVTALTIDERQQVHSAQVVLDTAQEGSFGQRGVFAVHQIGDTTVIDYPHDLPTSSMFISMSHNPAKSSSIFNASQLGLAETSHAFAVDSAGRLCDLWPLLDDSLIGRSGSMQVSASVTLSALCAKEENKLVQSRNQWYLYKGLLWDGNVGGAAFPTYLIARADGAKLLVASSATPDHVIFSESPSIPARVGVSNIEIVAANDRYYITRALGNASKVLHLTDRGSSNGKERLVQAVSSYSQFRLIGDWLIEMVQCSTAVTRIVEQRNAAITKGQQLTDDAQASFLRERGSMYRPSGQLVLYNLRSEQRLEFQGGSPDDEVIGISDKGFYVRDGATVALYAATALQLILKRRIVSNPLMFDVHWVLAD